MDFLEERLSKSHYFSALISSDNHQRSFLPTDETMDSILKIEVYAEIGKRDLLFTGVEVKRAMYLESEDLGSNPDSDSATYYMYDLGQIK